MGERMGEQEQFAFCCLDNNGQVGRVGSASEQSQEKTLPTRIRNWRMDAPDCTEFIIYCSAIWLCKFSLASFSLILRILFCQFSFSFKHLCSQNQACWHVQFPKFAIEVFFLWNFANQLKVRDFANLCIHSNFLLLHPSLNLQSSFLWLTSNCFSHIICKAATRIVQNMSRKSASSCCRYPQVIWFSKRVSEIQEKKSDFKLRLQNRIR